MVWMSMIVFPSLGKLSKLWIRNAAIGLEEVHIMPNIRFPLEGTLTQLFLSFSL